MRNYGDLQVYRKAFQLSMSIYKVTRRFPKEEIYSLSDQIRRSSRSVCANFAEAYSRRRYPAHFLSKVADCDAENAETGVWLEFSYACDYINKEQYDKLIFQKEEIGRLLGDILKNPQKYC